MTSFRSLAAMFTLAVLLLATESGSEQQSAASHPHIVAADAEPPLFLIDQFNVITTNMKSEPVMPFEDDAVFIGRP